MAIVGLTHNEDGVMESKVVKFRGKISTGWGPMEGPNNKNYPCAAGYFIAMKEETINQRVGTKTVPITKWVENKKVQEALNVSANSPSPRQLELVCLYKSPEDFWDSFMAKYSNGEGLMCRSNGLGTEAKYLAFDANGDRMWKKKMCEFDKCADCISGECKPMGVLKLYPTADATPPNPYKMETRSINTIRNIESSLEDIWNLIRLAHATKEKEAGCTLPFDGMFGLKLFLNHKKTKSGGRDIFVTELLSSMKFRESIMKVISRAVEHNTENIGLEGNEQQQSLLDTAAALMIDNEQPAEDSSDEVEVQGVEVVSAEDAEMAAAIDASMALLDES